MSRHRHVRQQAGTVTDNPVRLDDEKAIQIVEALNADLAARYVLYHQLRKHRWTVAGPESEALRDFLEAAADRAAAAADDIADRVRTLGGVPVSGPAALERHSAVPFEGEDVYDVHTSLGNDLEAHGDIIESVSSHIELAEGHGDHTTGHLLREQLVNIERDAAVIDAFLAENSLSHG